MQADKTLNRPYSAADVQLLGKTNVYQGFFHIDVLQVRHRLFAGGWSDAFVREIFERGDAAAVLPYDPVLDAVVLVEQFRVGALRSQNSPWLLEIVAGVMDIADEQPLAVIHREAREEAGLTLNHIEAICDYWVSPGGSSERMHLFCAAVNAQQAPAHAGIAHENEDIRIHVVPADVAVGGIATGAIDNATTIIALQWLQLNRDRLRQQWRHD